MEKPKANKEGLLEAVQLKVSENGQAAAGVVNVIDELAAGIVDNYTVREVAQKLRMIQAACKNIHSELLQLFDDIDAAL